MSSAINSDRSDLRMRTFLVTFLQSAGRQIQPREEKHYRQADDEAQELENDSARVHKLLDKVKSITYGFGDDMKTVTEMVEMHYKKKWTMDYFELTLVLACLVYVVTPLDAIPDTLPGVGYADDAVIVKNTVHIIRGNIVAFRAWKGENKDAYLSGKAEKIDICPCDCIVL